MTDLEKQLRAEIRSYWPWPWTKPIDHYYSDGPPVRMEVEIKGIPLRFRVTPTDESGINTGRTRFKVECLTCMSVLHHGTTGTTDRLQNHAEFDHGLIWGPIGVLFERFHMEDGYRYVERKYDVGVITPCAIDCWRRDGVRRQPRA